MESLVLNSYPDHVTTTSNTLKNARLSKISSNPQIFIEQALNYILPDQSAENKVIRIRRTLGKTAETFLDQQLECLSTEFQYLLDTWLDEYEKEVFDGRTLKVLLNEM